MLSNKKQIRSRAKNILMTYMNDGDLKNNSSPMKYYFSALKYIIKYGGINTIN